MPLASVISPFVRYLKLSIFSPISFLPAACGCAGTDILFLPVTIHPSHSPPSLAPFPLLEAQVDVSCIPSQSALFICIDLGSTACGLGPGIPVVALSTETRCYRPSTTQTRPVRNTGYNVPRSKSSGTAGSCRALSRLAVGFSDRTDCGTLWRLAVSLLLPWTGPVPTPYS